MPLFNSHLFIHLLSDCTFLFYKKRDGEKKIDKRESISLDSLLNLFNNNNSNLNFLYLILFSFKELETFFFNFYNVLMWFREIKHFSTVTLCSINKSFGIPKDCIASFPVAQQIGGKGETWKTRRNGV